MALGYSVHVGRDPPPALQPGTAGSARSQAAPPSWLALAVPRARLYGPLSASLLCLHLSCRILSSVCQGVCPTPSLWAFVWPPLLFPVHLLLAPASAAPQRPVRENSTFFFLPHAIRSCSRRAASPTQGLACGDCLEVASRVRANARVNFRVHHRVEIGEEKESSLPRRRGDPAACQAARCARRLHARRGEPRLPGRSASDDSLAEFSSGSRGSAARARWKLGPMSCGGGGGGRSPSGSLSRLMPPLKASMEVGTTTGAPGAGAGSARPPRLRPVGGGTRERRLSGCPPGLPAPTATPPALHRPLRAAGPGSELGAPPRVPAAPAGPGPSPYLRPVCF